MFTAAQPVAVLRRPADRRAPGCPLDGPRRRARRVAASPRQPPDRAVPLDQGRRWRGWEIAGDPRRGARGGRDQCRGGLGLADHLPYPARVRLSRPSSRTSPTTSGSSPATSAAAFGYREELSGQRGRLVRLGIASLAGSVAGACALLALPPGVFKVVVPALIIVACVLVVLQPWLSAWVAAPRQGACRARRPHPVRRRLPGRRLRRLLRRRAGCPADRVARDLPDREPAADQRGQERARHDRERGRGRGVRHLRPRQLAGGAADRGRDRRPAA